MAAATVLRTCTQVGICVGCWAPPRFARGQARGFLREEVTVSIAPGLPCGDTDLHARGYGCAYGNAYYARRGEGACARENRFDVRRGARARAREPLCTRRGRRSRAARAEQ